jgi:glucan biosynthesis protein C
MNPGIMQSTEGLSKSTGSTPRLFYIDHLRAFIIILVILHHVAIMYGAGVPFYYVEPPTNSPQAFLILLIFLLVNQSWFMGALFFLSGYFTPGSFDRKGIKSFIIDRLLCLGIPIAVFYFLLSPLSSIGYWHMPSSLTGIANLISW